MYIYLSTLFTETTHSKISSAVRSAFLATAVFLAGLEVGIGNNLLATVYRYAFHTDDAWYVHEMLDVMIKFRLIVRLFQYPINQQSNSLFVAALLGTIRHLDRSEVQGLVVFARFWH